MRKSIQKKRSYRKKSKSKSRSKRRQSRSRSKSRSRCQKGGYSSFKAPTGDYIRPRVPFQLTGGYANLSLPPSPYTRKLHLGGGANEDQELINKIQKVVSDLKEKLTNLCDSTPPDS